MSVSSEVQRTLVKSPPELWAELSDPTTLARHLGELGEIRILRTEPDRAVDWEAAAADGAQATGRVEIEPSGWGTRVTLSAQRMVVAPEPEPKPESAVEAESEQIETIEDVPVTSEVEPEPEPEPTESEDIVEVEPETVEPTPRPRFFARFFRRRRQSEPEAEPTVQSTSEPAVEPNPEPTAAVEVEESVVETPSEQPAQAEQVSEGPSIESSSDTPEPDISAELTELEQQTAAVLTGVLDRLGSAHHRPFSRS